MSKQILCRCGQKAVMRTVRKEGPNTGRQFFTCEQSPSCNFFLWADDPRATAVASSPGAAAGAAGGSQSPVATGAKLQIEIEAVSANEVEVRLRGRVLPSVTAALDAAGAKSRGGPDRRMPLSGVAALQASLARESGVTVKAPPPHVVQLLQRRSSQLDRGEMEQLMAGLRLRHPKLFPFQIEGVARAVRWGGRCLLADEMGLGKTAQAIAVLAHFSAKRPVLVVCPKTMRENWRNELLLWELVSSQEVCVVSSSKDRIDSGAAVVVISYEQVGKHTKSLQSRTWQAFVLDESHMLKNGKAARTKSIVPLMERAGADAVVMLLSGTPALSRPAELYSQLSMLGALESLSFKKYGDRYCRPTFNRFSNAIEYKGHEFLVELNVLLNSTCMIRRKKMDVLKQLPSKMRSKVLLEPTGGGSSASLQSGAIDVAALQREMSKNGGLSAESRNLFSQTAEQKIEPVKEYLSNLMDSDESEAPFLLFAHHGVLMDALEEFLKGRCNYIRIDGSTSNRAQLVDRFQQTPSCRVALLSVTAAGVGITLTKASVVIFAELFWNPGSLLQCEDRCHRIGQQQCVAIRYLLLKNSLDEVIWCLLDQKMGVLSQALGDDAGTLMAEVEREVHSPVRPAASAATAASVATVAVKSPAKSGPRLPSQAALMFNVRVKSNLFSERVVSVMSGSTFKSLATQVGAMLDGAAVAVACQGLHKTLEDNVPPVENCLVYLRVDLPSQPVVIDVLDDDAGATPVGVSPQRATPPPIPGSAKRGREMPPCKYGSLCYRKHPLHLAEYYHPQHDE